MAEAFEPLTVKGEGLTPSRIVWRRNRGPAVGRVEAMLAMNPGLAANAIEIPVGTKIALPARPADESAAPVAARVDLWT